jgi:tryptophan 2,3-dioxygenase
MNTNAVELSLPGNSEALAGRLAATALADLSRVDLAELSRWYDDARAGQQDDENDIILLLARPFSNRLTIPEYYRYTGLHVFGWFLSQQEDVFGGCLLAMHATLAELSKVERQEAARHPAEHLAERLRRLDTLIDQIGEVRVEPHSSLRGRDVVDRAGVDERLARQLLVLTRCCGFRRSDKHDEHIFIRSVLACELTFFMIRWVARQAISVIDLDRSEFFFRMNQLVDCADLLTGIFHALKTLSPELFLGFRDATGDASAVQSLNYHLMELVVYGYDERKEEAYTKFAHLGRISDPRLRAFRSLQDVAVASADQEVVDAFTRFERQLVVWRGRHYGFGRTYLPNMKGSGGTEGAGYLKRFTHKVGLRSGNILDDTEHLLSQFAFC